MHSHFVFFLGYATQSLLHHLKGFDHFFGFWQGTISYGTGKIDENKCDGCNERYDTVVAIIVHNSSMGIIFILNKLIKLCGDIILFMNRFIRFIYAQKIVMIYEEYSLIIVNIVFIIFVAMHMIFIAALCVLYIPIVVLFILFVYEIFKMNIRLIKQIPINLSHNEIERIFDIIELIVSIMYIGLDVVRIINVLHVVGMCLFVVHIFLSIINII